MASEMEIEAARTEFQRLEDMGAAQWDCIVHALLAAERVRWQPRWRHKKRGTSYEQIGHAELQSSCGPINEGEPLVIYRGEDGKLWARPVLDFHDGRFEPLPSPPEDK
jgi:hypothetical protein